MESLYFLIPGALIFIAIAIKVLFWAINSGQYDNLDTEAHRILFDGEKTKPLTEQSKKQLSKEQLLKKQQPKEQKDEQQKHE